MRRSTIITSSYILSLLILLLSGCTTTYHIEIPLTTQQSQNIISSYDCRASFSPWDIIWLPTDPGFIIQQIDNILSGSGLSGSGNSIYYDALDKQINPAFALAMFRIEASFAAPGTRANRNNNPGNIIATGECRGKPAGAACSGVYGEISTDGRFGVYANMQSGIQAYFRLLIKNMLLVVKEIVQSSHVSFRLIAPRQIVIPKSI